MSSQTPSPAPSPPRPSSQEGDHRSPTPADDQHLIDQLAQAVNAGQLDRANDIIDQLGSRLPQRLIRPLAELQMMQQRWSQAAKLLDQLPRPTAAEQLTRTSARNFAAAQQHHPHLYQRIRNRAAAGPYHVKHNHDSPALIARQHADGALISLSASAQPDRDAQRNIDELRKNACDGLGVLCLGLGDGYLLSALAKNPPQQFMHMAEPVFIIEPDSALVQTCMQVHDWSGDDAPLTASRFEWFVGPDWLTQLKDRLQHQPTLNLPNAVVELPPHSRDLPQHITALRQSLSQELDACRQRIEARDKARQPQPHADAQTLIDLLSKQGPRPPRVLIPTTRFSTVLQYAARDAAHSFESLGWDVHLLIEHDDHHRVTNRAINRTLDAFNPDLIFVIDHLRREADDIWPTNTPFVCWVQDQLPNITSTQAGRSVNHREFVLSQWRQYDIAHYDYPPRQILQFAKLSRPPEPTAIHTPSRDRADAPDLLYVSNWSHTPEQAIQRAVDAGRNLAPQALIRAYAETAIHHYQQGGLFDSFGQIHRTIETCRADLDLPPLSAEAMRKLIHLLIFHINNLLCRQTSLNWAAQLAQQRNLTLAIHGQGWENHPDFKQFARGPIAYGPDLTAVTAAAGFTLFLEPYVFTGHQRFVDALLAGGLVLARGNLATRLLNELTIMLGRLDREHNLQLDQTPDPQRDDRAQRIRQTITPAQRDQLHALLAQWDDAGTPAADIDKTLDVLDMVDAGFATLGQPLLPDLDRITFNSPAQLAHCIDALTQDPQLRADVQHRQHTAIEQRYTYAAGLERVIDWIIRRLRTQADASSPTDTPQPPKANQESQA